jgi:hypothetical protein
MFVASCGSDRPSTTEALEIYCEWEDDCGRWPSAESCVDAYRRSLLSRSDACRERFIDLAICVEGKSCSACFDEFQDTEEECEELLLGPMPT